MEVIFDRSENQVASTAFRRIRSATLKSANRLVTIVATVVSKLADAGAVFLVLLFFVMPAWAQTTTGDAAAGQTLYNTHCDGCHGATVGSLSAAIKNAANAGGLINLVMDQGMGGYTTGSFTSTQENDIAAYIAQQVSESSPSGVAITHNVTSGFINMVNIFANTSYGDIAQGQFKSGATRGAVTFSTSGSTIRATYNPDAGQCGTDTIYYRGETAGGIDRTNQRQFSVDIADPAAPILSSTTATRVGTVGVFASWSATNTGGASTEWDISSGTLPAGLSVSTSGTISGTPTAAFVSGTDVTLRARNCLNGNLTGQSATRVINITINKGTQAALTARINASSAPLATTYSNPNGSGALTTIGGSGGGAVTYATLTPTFCTISGVSPNFVVNYIAGNGTCTVQATKALDANYNAATDSVSILINKASQTITFNAQTTPSRSYVFGGSFLISPTATTTASGLTVTYDSNTTGVCSHPGNSTTAVSMLTAGTCTIGANQAGDGNYLAATEVPQSVTINPILPQPPTIGTGVGGSNQAVVNFTAPTNTGGTTIIDYTATCTSAGRTTRTATVASSPATVLLLDNGFTYSCSVKSSNSVGASTAASGTVMVTPSATPVAPTITSGSNANFTVFSSGSFQVTATGTPSTFTYARTGTLPTGVTFNTGTGLFSGTPAAGTAGLYTQMLTVSNGTAPNATQSFGLLVFKASQTITAPALANRPMRPVPTSASAGVSASSGLAVTYSIASGNCAMVGSNIFTGGVGNCTVVASQSGNANYNAATAVNRSFTITQGTQTLNFGAQSGRVYSPAGMFTVDPKALPVDSIDLITENGLAATHSSLTPLVCTISDIDITIQSAGTCTIEATQAGNANYAAATPVSHDIAIAQASQTIAWGAQSGQTFGTGGTFMISPLASGGASGNAIVYGTTTPTVCSVTGTTVTKLTSGVCTLSANQAGSDNYSAATQVTRALAINASVPTAPIATIITSSDAQVRIEFDQPTSDGGSPITTYRATCNPGAIFTDGSASPLLVVGLTNNTLYTCSVRAQNSAGLSPSSNNLMATPILDTGVNLWTNTCSGCHTATPSGVRFNAAGTTGSVINYVRSVQANMLGNNAVQALTLNELGEIAKYIETFVPAISANTAFNTPVNVDVSTHLTLGTVSFTTADVVTGPSNGSLGSFTGTGITYTPNAGYVGSDMFTYRGNRPAPGVPGDAHTVTVTVAPPPAPVITSSTTANATFSVSSNYQITATNSPVSFSASGLPAGCSINTANGLINCVATVTGVFMATVSATNLGGTGMQSVTVTVSKANQSITFGAQGAQTYALGGSFAINPVATADDSGLAVTHSSLTTGVCTVSGTTVTMVTAGTCTLAADQGGNANYNAALQATRNVSISATVPGAPTIGSATPGDTQAAIAFTAPANNGGTPITGYTASCTPGMVSAMGSASPITVTGLTNSTPYTCAVRATNAQGNSVFSGTVMVTPTATPVAPAITSANATTFTVLSAGNFNVTATGTPAPTWMQSGSLPTGVTFSTMTGLLSGTPATGMVGSYPLTFTATNGSGSAMQSFTLTVQKANQTITFTSPGTQTYTASSIPLSASSTSLLTVAFASNSPSVCTVAGANLTLVTVGVCSITASQIGNGDYNAATGVTRAFSVTAANQTITFNTQTPASRSFLAGSTFSISPTATASSGLTVLYSSITTGICTVAGTTVTIIAPGTCTIAANQGGNANYNAATQATQNVSLNTTAPGAPTIGIATGGNGQATIEFTAPTNNGGSAITGYIATCNPGSVTGNATVTPVVVSGLTNSTQYTCSVAAINAIGTGASSATVNVTPLSGQGSTIWANVCNSCHTSVPGGNQLNGAGTTATVLNFVRANQPLMLANSNVQALTNADLIDLATYIAANLPVIAPTTAMNTPVNIDVDHHITLTGEVWSAFTSVEVVTGPTNGMVGSFTGTQITYTPNNGFVGTDTFTYRGKRGATHNGDPQTVTITVFPPAPVINSSLSVSGTFGTLFAYQIDATQSPTSFDATGLPAGLSINTGTGNIFGTPGAAGSFGVGLSATNAGGTGEATLMLTINPATQTITFGAQSSPRTWSAGGNFAISPVATGGASGNAIGYSSLTIGVCTVSGTTVSIVSAGICTIAADQAGNANYAAATQVTRSVIINAILPGAPTGLMASAGDTVASLTFTAPASNGGATITGYSASCTPSAPGNASASPINLTALTNGVQYTCTVSATNSAGSSSSSSVMFTPNQTPVAPSFTNTNSTSVNVTEPLSFQASASGTPAVFTFGSTGTLPSGVSFSAAGLFSGTPVSGTSGSYPLTLTVTNSAGSAMQSFTLTVSKLAQTITFANPGAQSFSGSPILLSPSATSGLTVALASNTPAVCTVSGLQVSFVATGQCNLTASRAGNADYLAATPVIQEFTIGVSSQTITFPVQSPSTRSFSSGGSFAINPLATASSGLAVAYSSTTTSVCTVVGQNVTMVAVGTCTIAANQTGNANYSAAAQVTRSVTINAVAASAPQNVAVVARDGRGVFSFDPPANNGGGTITSYTVTCSPGGATANGAASPITVSGLTNGVSHSCSVVANNAAGAGTAANFSAFTPNVQAGSAYWSQVCTQCHATTPTVPQLNAAGTTTAVLNYVIANQPLMSAEPSVTSLTTAEKQAIVAYITSVIPASAETTPFNTAKVIDLSSQIAVGTVSFENLAIVTMPANGTLSAITGTSITYTPTTGYAGADSFTFRGVRATPSVLQGDARTVNITVQVPPAPVITSATTASATFGVSSNYQITATNSPVSYAASGLPGGCSINTANGLVSCTPTATGSFMVTVTATNPGGTGMQTVTVTVSAANQTITFNAQGGQTYALGGTFAINPVATASSGLAVTHSSLTTSVCTVSGTTVTMVSAGTCTLAADQGGNGNYNSALQVTRSVAISATVPGAPTGLAATAGVGTASLTFTPPANTGGIAITNYTANCTPSATGNATTSPISLTGLTIGTPYTCTVSASNAQGTGAASTSVMFTPTAALVAPAFTSNNAVSFDVLAASSFNVTATGNEAPVLSVTPAPPSGLTFTPGTGVLGGTPATGTAGTYPLTFTATNSQGTVMQSFTLTIAKLNQTITFANPGTQTYTASSIPLVASSTSSLTVAFASNSTSVCTVSGTNLTLVTVGVCSITASQSGNGNYNAATNVTRAFSVNAANQSITFNTQTTASRSFLAGSTFSISPIATASSGLTILYSSTTTGICTVAGITVTMVAPGTCTIAANQGGNANYNAATQVTQNVALNATAPGAPTIGTATGGNGQATIEFTAPANNGGSAITGYIATCNPGGVTGNASASPIIVSGLTNGTQYTCSVTASNAVGPSAPSGTVNVTPLSGQGATLWTNVCDVCHTSAPTGNQFNAAGTTGTVLNFVRANQPLMAFNTNVQNLSAGELADIAAYITANLSVNAPTTTVNNAVMVDLNHHITLTGQAWSAFTSIEIVTGPVNGSLGSVTGTQVQYTPNPGYIGTDTFTYRGKRGVTHNGDPQTITITVTPPVPGISSALVVDSWFGVAFSYQITASNSPTSFGASGLPAGLSVNTMTGAISGTPTETGSFAVTVLATNAGGNGQATLMLTVAKAAQSITFGAQSSPRQWSSGGSFAISPVATGGGSGNPVVYAAQTPAVCTVSVTTVSIVSAGTCTISANQAGDANYAAAPEVTRDVSITAISPTAPVIGTATPGNAQATVSFSPPTSNGGAAIETYTVTCGAQSATGPASPITVTGLANGVTVNCSVTASNALAASSPSSGSVMVTPVALTFTGTVYSRKTHGGIDLNVTIAAGLITSPTITVEPRSIGAGHRIVFTFSGIVSSVTSVSAIDVNAASIGAATPSFSNSNELVVTLTGIPDGQRVTVNVVGANGAVNASASMGFLVGDVNDTRSVNAADISAVRANLNLTAGNNNFRMDMDATGTITSSDVSTVKAKSGRVLP